MKLIKKVCMRARIHTHMHTSTRALYVQNLLLMLKASYWVYESEALPLRVSDILRSRQQTEWGAQR